MDNPSFSKHLSHVVYDVVVGGATSGSAIAWFLATNPDFKGKVLVVERDASLTNSATKASKNCMRQQFATSVNVQIAQYAAKFVKNFRGNLGDDVPEIPIRNFGYLYLADTPEFAKTLKKPSDFKPLMEPERRSFPPKTSPTGTPFLPLTSKWAASTPLTRVP